MKAGKNKIAAPGDQDAAAIGVSKKKGKGVGASKQKGKGEEVKTDRFPSFDTWIEGEMCHLGP